MKRLTTFHKLVILFVVGTTSVLPTLWGDFVFDDGEAIVKNADVTSSQWEYVGKIFKHDFWGVDLTHRLSHKSYRPLTTLTYRLEYQLWGHNPFPFHLLDLLLHGINCVFVFLFLKKCLQFDRNGYGITVGSNKMEQVSFWTALLFSVHPVHVEPLGAIVGRADLLGSLVFLGAFCFIPDHESISGILWLSACSMIGALLKETAIALSVFCIFVKVFGLSDHPKRAVVLLKCLLIAALAGTFVLWRLWFQDGPPVFQPYDNPPAFAPTMFSKIFSIVYVWFLNMFLLANPIWLCYDWSMGCVDLIESFWDPRFFLVILFLIVCLRVAYLGCKNRLIMISIVIFGSTFLPSSNVLFTVGFVLAERNLYLPSIGFCLFVTHAFIQKERKKWLLFIILMFYLKSLHRSTEWINQGRLFKSGLQVCPNNAKIHYNLGTLYGDLGEPSQAEKSYKTAIALRSDYYQAMNNLGNLLRVNHNQKEAETWLRKAVTIKSDFAAAWMNLGIVLSSVNKTEALECYRKALKFRKAYPDCEYNLGNLVLEMGDKVGALTAWNRAISLKPSHSQAWINSVILLEQDGNLSEAKDMALKALKVVPLEDTLHFILGNILGKLSEFDSAKSSFEKAIRISSQKERKVPPKYFSNLGVLYHRWGKKSEAIQAYQKALTLDPRLSSTKKNLEMLLKARES